MKPAFTRVNKYIFDPKAWAWNLPAGTTCPGARECLAKADRESGKLTKGPDAIFTCYAAVTERFPSVRERVWTNLEAVKGKSPEQVAEVLECLPPRAKRVRIHSDGDFFSQNYFEGWLLFIRSRPDVHFWAFTKSIPFWLRFIDQIPENLVLTASYGGRHDDLIEPNGLRSARVVYSQAEADYPGLEIDRDDSLAAFPGSSFALLENFTKQETLGAR